MNEIHDDVTLYLFIIIYLPIDFLFDNFIGQKRKLVYTNEIGNKSFSELYRIIIKKGGLFFISEWIYFNRNFKRGLIYACDFV